MTELTLHLHDHCERSCQCELVLTWMDIAYERCSVHS